MDTAVKAHPCCDDHGKELCKVSALYYDPFGNDLGDGYGPRGFLISSGDDGYIHQWDVGTGSNGGWTKRTPMRSINFNLWVTPELKGALVKNDDKELEKANPKMGKPAAAHSLCGDDKGNLLVGTVCNEIYELRFDSDEPPFCYMQGHYDELWGLATHPSKLEFCTAAEDETLRVWDLERRQMRAMAKIEGAIRCACYSPDGKMIAVGLGSS